MDEIDRSTVDRLLTERGLAALLPVHPVARRLGCTLWDTRVLTVYGDADAQIQVYSLGQQPECFVDMQEEITALIDGPSGRVLVKEMQDDMWGILITCAKGDAPFFKRFFSEAIPEDLSLTYHPQLDRILGGDYFRKLEGKWLKACLAPFERAMEIKNLVTEARQAYQDGPNWPGHLDTPLPVLMAVIETETLQLQGAPGNYNKLTSMLFCIDSPETIKDKPASHANQLEAFARQLFGFLATQHKTGLCFSRDAGCCLVPEFLLANGSLTDVYFISRPEKGSALARARKTDLLNALIVTCEMGSDSPKVAAAMATAVAQYTGKESLPKDVMALIESVALSILNHEKRALVALVNMLLLPQFQIDDIS